MKINEVTESYFFKGNWIRRDTITYREMIKVRDYVKENAIAGYFDRKSKLNKHLTKQQVFDILFGVGDDSKLDKPIHYMCYKKILKEFKDIIKKEV